MNLDMLPALLPLLLSNLLLITLFMLAKNLHHHPRLLRNLKKDAAKYGGVLLLLGLASVLLLASPKGFTYSPGGTYPHTPGHTASLHVPSSYTIGGSGSLTVSCNLNYLLPNDLQVVQCIGSGYTELRFTFAVDPQYFLNQSYLQLEYKVTSRDGNSVPLVNLLLQTSFAFTVFAVMPTTSVLLYSGWGDTTTKLKLTYLTPYISNNKLEVLLAVENKWLFVNLIGYAAGFVYEIDTAALYW